MGRVTSTTEMRALHGRTIVITRAAAQAQRFVDLLEAEGARVLAAPTIAIDPPPSWEALDVALDAIGHEAAPRLLLLSCRIPSLCAGG